MDMILSKHVSYQVLRDIVEYIMLMCGKHKLYSNGCYTWVSTRFNDSIHIASDEHRFLVKIENSSILYGQRKLDDSYMETYRLRNGEQVHNVIDNPHVAQMTVWLLESYVMMQHVDVSNKTLKD